MSVWYTEHYWQVTVSAMLSLCHCPSLPFSATKNCKSQARHAVFSKGTSHLLCLLISGSSCWKSRRQNTIFQHRNHANSMSTATVFSFPFFLSPNLSPSLLWKRQIEFNMRLDSHELVQRCSWTACRLLPQPEIGGTIGNVFVYSLWLTLPWG